VSGKPFNPGDPSTYETLADLVRNTQLSNPNLTPAQVDNLVYGPSGPGPGEPSAASTATPSTPTPSMTTPSTSTPSTTTSVGPATVGEQRMVNGQLAQWTGQGWVAV
jgi:hypothetical protein